MFSCKHLLTMLTLITLVSFAFGTGVQAVNFEDWQRIPGSVGASSKYGSGWLDLAPATDFRKGEKMRLSVGGSASRILVRLLQSGSEPDDEVGILGDYRVPAD